jgi:propionate CoA-transferase
LEVVYEGDRLRIVREGRVAKFVKDVQQVSFSGPIAREAQRDVLFVTERAVFRLREGGIELIEVAAGIDVRRDVVAKMEFPPIIRSVGRMAIRTGGLA